MPIQIDPNLNVDPLPNRIGAPTGYANFSNIGTLTPAGSATTSEDLRIDAITIPLGAVTPTDTTGFRGNADFKTRNFVHNQADEVQFDIQFPHDTKLGATCYPHVHFSPVTSGSGAVQFIFEFYPANVNAQFPASTTSASLYKQWTAADRSWYHLIATQNAGITIADSDLSSIWKCRLYRDNTIAGNFLAAVSGLYIDIHYERDSLGSNTEYEK